jgi:hypothetical protein
LIQIKNAKTLPEPFAAAPEALQKASAASIFCLLRGISPKFRPEYCEMKAAPNKEEIASASLKGDAAFESRGRLGSGPRHRVNAFSGWRV